MWKFSFSIIFVVVSYKIFFRQIDEHCDGSLLKKGAFVNDTEWVPDGGCAMKNYSSRETRNCFLELSGGQPASIHLIGDSILRKLHDSIIDGINGEQIGYQGIHVDRLYSDRQQKLNINFYWYPGPSLEIKDMCFDKWKQGNEKLLIVVIGTVLHTIKQYSLSHNISYGYEIFKKNLTTLVPSFQDLTSMTDVLWFAQPYAVEWTHVEGQRRYIDMFNLGSKIVLSKTKVKIWSSAKMIIELKPWMYKDRVHPKREIYDDYYRQILFNFMCNKLEPLPNNLCCNSSPNSAEKAKRHLIVTGVVSFALFLVWIYRKRKNGHLNERKHQLCVNVTKQDENDINVAKNSTYISSKETLIIQSVKYAFVMLFIYLCEKEQLLGMEEKFKFSATQFSLPLLLFFIPAALTVKKTNCEGTQYKDLANELKGWMLLVLFAYDMMSVDTANPINLLINQLVSTYLFITGFNLFTHYWKGGDMSFKQYVQVIFRMNFTTVVLCLVLGQSYQFYYLVPLLTVWYTIAFLILAFPPAFHLPEETRPQAKDYIIVLARLAILAVFSISLGWSQDIFGAIFKFLTWHFLLYTGETKDEDWKEIWNLNIFSIFYGMLFALVSNAISQHVREMMKISSSFKRSILWISLGCTLLCLYYVLLIHPVKESHFNNIHPFIVWLPILGYAVLRSSTVTLLSYQSTFLANIGEMYIEFFIFLHHILLTDNARYLLVLVPESSLVNVAATTFILFTISQEIHNINLYITKCLAYVINGLK